MNSTDPLSPKRFSSPHDLKGETSRPDRVLEILVGVSVLVFVSALWVETDAYRFAGVALLLVGLWHYVRYNRGRIRIGWIGTICYAWGIYVAVRFAYNLLVYPEMGDGSAEGIYLFPLLYPLLGYTFFAYVKRPFRIATVFMVISAAFVVASTDYASLLGGERAWESFHNNPIHAAVANGILVLCSVGYCLHVLGRRDLPPYMLLLLVGVSAVTFLVGLASIYVLQSKGVWVAVAVSLPFLILLVALTHKNRTIRLGALAFLSVLTIASIGAFEQLQTIGGETFWGSMELLSAALSGEGWTSFLAKAEHLPQQMQERVVLWANAVYVWSKAPVFGSGVSWLYYWNNNPALTPPYNLIHNGFLEIAVRYGLIGLSFYFILFITFIYYTYLAYKNNNIDKIVYLSFITILVSYLATLATNSNSRLAIGESLMWMMSAIGFYCFYKLQQSGIVRPRTPI